MPRPVDTAMAEDRPAKRAIRQAWLDRITQLSNPGAGARTPLYLTLAGAEGRDIATLVEAGLIRLLGNGAVHPEDAHKVVAVESREAACAELRSRYPGLKARNEDLAALLRSTRRVTWPDRPEQDVCRAAVVNLDFDSSLEAGLESGHLVFPKLRLIEKIATLHANEPRVEEWTLFLTVNASINWSQAAERAVVRLLADNFDNQPAFATASRDVLGDTLYGRLERREQEVGIKGLETPRRQKLLLLTVPKKVTQDNLGQGWRVETRTGLRYGAGPSAGMVTWRFDFLSDVRATAEPQAVYTQCLETILEGAGQLDETGALAEL